MSDDTAAALSLWEALVMGRWSLVDHHDSDGRRYLVVVRNPPGLTAPKALTPRERYVLGYAAMGHPLKLVSYELGLSAADVSGSLRSGMGKLGIRSRAELVCLFCGGAAPQSERRRRTSRDPEEPEDVWEDQDVLE